MASYILPGKEQLGAFAEAMADVTPILMLNLLRYREQADYTGLPDEAPCSGREAYARYKAGVVPCLETAGAKLQFAGLATATVIGPADEDWDEVLIVEYPSVDAMTGMLASPAYQAIAHHRSAALADSRLVAMHSPDEN